MLPTRIEHFLNAGDIVAAEITPAGSATRVFVCISPRPKPGVPREERRYLNSTWSMWEYWDFEFRRMTLRTGWEDDEWNYDRYLLADERRTTYAPDDFANTLTQWVPDASLLKHCTESACP